MTTISILLLAILLLYLRSYWKRRTEPLPCFTGGEYTILPRYKWEALLKKEMERQKEPVGHNLTFHVESEVRLADSEKVC